MSSIRRRRSSETRKVFFLKETIIQLSCVDVVSHDQLILRTICKQKKISDRIFRFCALCFVVRSVFGKFTNQRLWPLCVLIWFKYFFSLLDCFLFFFLQSSSSIFKSIFSTDWFSCKTSFSSQPLVRVEKRWRILGSWPVTFFLIVFHASSPDAFIDHA